MTKRRYPMIPGVRIVPEFPRGYRWLGECIRQTEKAGLFRYFGWELWIPKSRAVQISGCAYAAPAECIENAKAYLEEKQNANAD